MKQSNKRQKIRRALILFSFLFFPFTVFFFSPFLIVWAGIYGILSGSMVLFIGQFILSLFFGRAFCGWICPGAGIQECCTLGTDKKAKNDKRSNIKYFIFVPWLLTIIYLIIRAGGIKTVDLLFNTNNGMPLLTIHGYFIYFGIVILFVVLSFTLGTRSFCHMFCWMAPFMVIGTKIKNKLNYPSLRLIAYSDKCINCKRCTKRCPMGLDVESMVKTNNTLNNECILCGECADSCNANAVKLGFRD